MFGGGAASRVVDRTGIVRGFVISCYRRGGWRYSVFCLHTKASEDDCSVTRGPL